MTAPSATASELAHLGAGGAHDRLRFRLVLRILLRCAPLLWEVRWHLAAMLGALTCTVLLLVIPVTQMIDMFWSKVLGGEALTDPQLRLLLLERGDVTPWDEAARRMTLRRVVGLGSTIVVVAACAFTPLVYYRVWVLQRVNQVLRLKLLDRLQALSLRFHSDSTVGDAIYRMYQDSAMVTQLIDVLFITPLRSIARLGFSLLVVYAFEPALAALFLVAWPVALGLGAGFSRPLRVGFRQAREGNSRLTAFLQERLGAIRVIKAYGAEFAEQGGFERHSRAAFEAAYAARNRLALYRMLVFFAFALVVVGAHAWSALLTMDGAALYGADVPLLRKFIATLAFSVWNLGMWNNFKIRIGDAGNASRDLMGLWGRVQDIAIGLDRVFEMLDLEPEVQDARDAIAMPSLREGVAFEGVSFGYDRARPVIDGVSFAARAGTITAVVGPTGAGKSTLMSLLLRLYDPERGHVRVDGTDVRRFTLASLRANIAIALQEHVLFGTTIRENIRYAVPDASDARVREAARIAVADRFIEPLPEGYDTTLGERGAKLSTGQRQRLSIARAVLKDTPILILDEPTAALDAHTEIEVLQNLATWGRGRAIFIITHRLSTIRRADQIVFLQDGRLLETGSHDTLMVRPDGAYRALVTAETTAAAGALA
jgi:ABC-type multidrug transport system fused ATPase/permease subunit